MCSVTMLSTQKKKSRCFTWFQNSFAFICTWVNKRPPDPLAQSGHNLRETLPYINSRCLCGQYGGEDRKRCPLGTGGQEVLRPQLEPSRQRGRLREADNLQPNMSHRLHHGRSAGLQEEIQQGGGRRKKRKGSKSAAAHDSKRSPTWDRLSSKTKQNRFYI